MYYFFANLITINFIVQNYKGTWLQPATYMQLLVL